MATKNSYNTGVKVGNWVEDSAGSRLAKVAMLAHPKLETTETRSQYLNRYAELRPSKPAGIATDVLSGHLVMAHGPNIIDQTLPNDHYLTTTAAVFKGVKPHTVVGPKGKFEGDGNRVDLIAEKARLVRRRGAAPLGFTTLNPLPSPPPAARRWHRPLGPARRVQDSGAHRASYRAPRRPGRGRHPRGHPGRAC
jgi:hypothetical protein